MPALSALVAAHVGEIVMHPRNFTGFEHHLLRLINKADAANRALLRNLYPDYVEAVEQWRASEGQVT